MTVEFLKELLEDPEYRNLSVKEFVEMLKSLGVWDFKPDTDPLGIDKLPKDDSTFSDSYMEVGK